MVIDMYSNRGLALEVEKLANHRRAILRAVDHAPSYIDPGCIVSGYVESQRGSSIYSALYRMSTDLCDKFGIKLCERRK